MPTAAIPIRPRPAERIPTAAKAIELKGWNFPRHLAGRTFSVVVHGDAAGAENLRRSLSDWLSDMGLIGAGHHAEIDRYVGYYEAMRRAIRPSTPIVPSRKRHATPHACSSMP